ncbi:hypothetical protein KR99_16085 [Ralstonia solanacearum]|nr:hypothetical protein KR99_16085 [Ralstonia solanacearum]
MCGQPLSHVGRLCSGGGRIQLEAAGDVGHSGSVQHMSLGAPGLAGIGPVCQHCGAQHRQRNRAALDCTRGGVAALKVRIEFAHRRDQVFVQADLVGRGELGTGRQRTVLSQP